MEEVGFMQWLIYLRQRLGNCWRMASTGLLFMDHADDGFIDFLIDYYLFCLLLLAVVVA
jgi:hypothetical protein